MRLRYRLHKKLLDKYVEFCYTIAKPLSRWLELDWWFFTTFRQINLLVPSYNEVIIEIEISVFISHICYINGWSLVYAPDFLCKVNYLEQYSRAKFLELFNAEK